MNTLIRSTLVAALAALASCASTDAPPLAPEPAAPGTNFEHDKTAFLTLLEDHKKITRTVREIDGGIESITESEDPATAALIYDHTLAMKARLERSSRIRQVDPIFVAIFDNHDKITLEVTRLPRGVLARETSPDPYVADLIRRHAEVVSGFTREGFEEFRRQHPVPPRDPAP